MATNGRLAGEKQKVLTHLRLLLDRNAEGVTAPDAPPTSSVTRHDGWFEIDAESPRMRYAHVAPEILVRALAHLLDIEFVEGERLHRRIEDHERTAECEPEDARLYVISHGAMALDMRPTPGGTRTQIYLPDSLFTSPFAIEALTEVSCAALDAAVDRIAHWTKHHPHEEWTERRAKRGERGATSRGGDNPPFIR
ncbi:MAG: hypothetical protein EB060_03800 [Proteobacteria bacterium]|nr:hypothetical protein [Pseudomonadota bacterium]